MRYKPAEFAIIIDVRARIKRNSRLIVHAFPNGCAGVFRVDVGNELEHYLGEVGFSHNRLIKGPV